VIELVLDERTADVDARLNAVIRRVRRERRAAESEFRRSHPRFRLIKAECLSMKLIAARFRDRGNDRAGRVIVLRAVVLSDDPELLHRALREGIPTAGVLSGSAALQHVVLGADAVDEDV